MNDMVYINKSDVLGSVLDTDIIRCSQGSTSHNQFINLAESHLSTVLHFPSVSENAEKRLVQEGNYEYFINTMADMIQKYAPVMLAEENVAE